MNTGGPAFPSDWKEFHPLTGEQVVSEQFPGMTLRDWFAGRALEGDLANPAEGPWTAEQARTLAYRCYKFADAMLTERNKPDSYPSAKVDPSCPSE